MTEVMAQQQQEEEEDEEDGAAPIYPRPRRSTWDGMTMRTYGGDSQNCKLTCAACKLLYRNPRHSGRS